MLMWMVVMMVIRDSMFARPAIVQPIRIQGRRVHRGVLRGLSRYALEGVQECVPAAPSSMIKRTTKVHVCHVYRARSTGRP